MAWSETRVGAGSAGPARPPHELLDDGFAPDPCGLLVIGCGNILRGDDAVGPVLVRTLFARGVPDDVRLVDGGTSGMDVAFGMRGAQRVVIVDAAATGAAPGTIFKVPASEIEELPPIDGLHTHNFRWDHALAFSEWLLGPQRPTDVTVILIEAQSTEFGDSLTSEVEAAMGRVADLIERDFYPAPSSGAGQCVEINRDGYLHLDADLARRHFPADACVARLSGDVLELMPLVNASHGGLVLRQRNPAGDRTLLIHEVLEFGGQHGRFRARWDEQQGVFKVDLTDSQEFGDADRSDGGGGPGVRTMDGLPSGAHRSGDRPESRLDPRLAIPGTPGGRRDQPHRSAPQSSRGGSR